MKKIEVKGVIISNDHKPAYDFYGVEATSPNDVISQLSNGEDVEVIISSGGGNVFAGSDIYFALKEHNGQVTVKIPSFAGSSASIIAMSGDRVLMSPTAQMMIHNVSVQNQGDYRAMEHTAEVLKNANETIANAYHLKTGLSHDEILSMMNKETWLSPQKAIELGFADEMMFKNEQSSDLQLVANTYQVAMLPQTVIEEFNKQKADSLQKDEVDFLMPKKLQAQIKLLKLKEIKNYEI